MKILYALENRPKGASGWPSDKTLPAEFPMYAYTTLQGAEWDCNYWNAQKSGVYRIRVLYVVPNWLARLVARLLTKVKMIWQAAS